MLDVITSDRRRRRAQARQDQILAAAAALFAQKGFHRTTTHDIAQAADLSEGTLYNYFEGKEDLLLGIMARLVQDQGLSTRLGANTTASAQVFFQEMLNERRAFIDQHQPMLQAVLSEILVDPELRQRYYQGLVFPLVQATEAHLAQRQVAGELCDLPAPHLARLISALVTGLYLLQVLEDPVVVGEWPALVETISQVIFDGVALG